MYFGCCIYVLLLLLNMPEMAHDWINKSILFYSKCLKTARLFHLGQKVVKFMYSGLTINRR